MQTRVLLSIKPEFVDKIFSGIKKYEFRRAIFKSKAVSKVVVYASSPVQRVVGEFELSHIISARPESLWRRTRKHSGIEKRYFDSYFEGKQAAHAIKIRSPRLYEEPLELQAHFGIERPPQSFCYLS